MLNVCGLTAGYGSKMILRDLSFQAEQGAITTLIGINGCGKTTLLKTLIGLLPLASGEILADEQPLSTLSGAKRAQKIAYLPQNRDVPAMTVEELVLQGRFPYLSYPRRYRKEDYDLTEKMLSQFDLLPFRDRMLSDLSGGMRQKAYLAMALVQSSPILLLDEPTSYLDIGHQFSLTDTLQMLRNQQKTILLVLHDLLLALSVSDRILLMDQGTILFSGSPDELLKTDLISRVFGVSIGILEDKEGIHYYYRPLTRTIPFS